MALKWELKASLMKGLLTHVWSGLKTSSKALAPSNSRKPHHPWVCRVWGKGATIRNGQERRQLDSGRDLQYRDVTMANW